MNGILLIDKPANITSNTLVQKVKAALGKKEKVGHTGTLDFFATGLMVITVGKATRFTEYFQKLDKEYLATGELGKITDTYDICGKVIEEKPCDVSDEEIKSAILSFVGEYDQMPPAYSSKRIQGKRAYQLAKKGIIPQLKPKRVKIYKIDVLSIEKPYFVIKVSCSSGTYIRSLIKDIGDKLGCGAYTYSLRRTKVGDFSVEESLKLEEITSEKLIENLIPLDKALSFIPAIYLDEGFDRRFLLGQRFKVPFDKEGLVRVFSKDGKFLGTGIIKENKILQPDKVIN